MKRAPTSRRRLGLLVALMALIASGCSASAQVEESAGGSGSESEPAAVQTPAAQPQEPTAEPTAQPTTQPTAETAQPSVTPTADPEPPPATPSEPADFRLDSILGVANSGAFAYAGTTSPWNTETACNAIAAETLAVIEIDAASTGNADPVGAGLTQTGDVNQLLFGDDNKAVVISSCGRTGERRSWMQRVVFGDNGQLSDTGDVIQLSTYTDGFVPYAVSFTDDMVMFRHFVQPDPDDDEAWVFEVSNVSIETGDATVVATYDPANDEAFLHPVRVSSPDGRFSYREILNPLELPGCEGSGIAATIEVDDGSGPRLALGEDTIGYANVGDLHFSDDGYVAWTSGCEGFTSAYVGRLTDDGTITDAHFVDFNLPRTDVYTDFQFYRLTSDGFLVAVGLQYESSDPALQVTRYELATDPHFVNSAERAPTIGQEPVLIAVANDESWHVGDTLAAEPACGSSTLYGKSSIGYNRAFAAGFELDTIVGAVAGETQIYEYEFGADFMTRTVVFATECPDEYQGQRLWYGTELASVSRGLWLERADMGEVAELLSVRDEVRPNSDFIQARFVEVVLLDGTIAEFELLAFPEG